MVVQRLTTRPSTTVPMPEILYTCEMDMRNASLWTSRDFGGGIATAPTTNPQRISVCRFRELSGTPSERFRRALIKVLTKKHICESYATAPTCWLSVCYGSFSFSLFASKRPHQLNTMQRKLQNGIETHRRELAVAFGRRTTSSRASYGGTQSFLYGPRHHRPGIITAHCALHTARR